MRIILGMLLMLITSGAFAMPLTWRTGISFSVEPDQMKERVKAEEESFYRKYEYQIRRTDEQLQKKREEALARRMAEEEALKKQTQERDEQIQRESGNEVSG